MPASHSTYERSAPIFITGVAGFIGFHIAKKILEGEKAVVVGIDNLNDYYDVTLKNNRLKQLSNFPSFHFIHSNITEWGVLKKIFEEWSPKIVIHLAAQAGVRYSLENPNAYVDSNLVGFVNVLEICRSFPIKHLLFASSSSVYGANTKIPFSVHHPTEHPVSLYGATKKAGEMLAHSYASLFGIPTTGLRLFTVYGPWGRPDMAYFKFVRDILHNKTIQVFGFGEMKRDFTFIDDVVAAVEHLIDHVPNANQHWSGESPDPATSYAPFRLYNIGNHTPVSLKELIQIIEELVGKKAKMEMLPMQLGDVKETFADVEDLKRTIGWGLHTSLYDGLRAFVDWYRGYYGIR